MMYLSVLKRPNMPSKWKSWNEELKRSQVNVAIMQQKNVIQPSFRLQNDDTSSMANNSPPTGAANAAETPAAAPAVVKLRLHSYHDRFGRSINTYTSLFIRNSDRMSIQTETSLNCTHNIFIFPLYTIKVEIQSKSN